ncbi:glycoside hydrolase family 3 C-terminal domain-containing protein [Streptomyces sp. NPDC058001]|uniref:glycoside hydrolase family 3 C-terminal domain-containing protein n=1 Tax=Streptomyces sp. NPDC058001 TaxID=3346300 RepID=UPI0036EAB8AC
MPDPELDARLDLLLGTLSLDRKVGLLSGGSTWSTADEPAVGLRAFTLSDGPVGVRGDSWDERSTSLLLPCPTAVAAMWNDDLAERLGRLLASEARRKGVQVVLAPNLNLHRSPLGGRHFECFAEDPWLTGRTGVAVIRGVQSRGVAATAKHYVANDSESERLTVDVQVGERALHEVYLAPFEAAVEAGVWLVMAAYNGVNGATMTANPLLGDPLKSAWGFDGVVVSDWGALRSTVGPAVAGHDLGMPGPDGPWGAALVRAVKEGLVPESAVDDKVRRVLRLGYRVGALGIGSWNDDVGVDGITGVVPGTAVVPATAVAPTTSVVPATASGPITTVGATTTAGPTTVGPAAASVTATAGCAEAESESEGARATLREAAAAGMVLLRNSGVLPLSSDGLRTVAVIGAHAVDPRMQGGGSAEVFPSSSVSPLDALRTALGPEVRVVHAPGPALGSPPAPLTPARARDPRSGKPGVLVRLLDASGRELYAEHRLSGRILEPRLVPDGHTVEITARFAPDRDGEWTFGVAGFGRMSLTVDEQTLVDGEFTRDTDDPAVVHVHPPRHDGTIALRANREVTVVARRALAPDTGRATVLSVSPPASADPATATEEARAAARGADAVVMVVGTTEQSESEGHDRASLRLSGHQDALVQAVLADSPDAVVVVNAGGPVEMPWHTDAGALLLTWFPGQEGGPALADVLLGRTEPGGRLPTTWAETLAEVPVRTVRPTRGVLAYDEGLHIGYRAWLRSRARPAYWFGHGLGYTSWSYETIDVAGQITGDQPVAIRVRVRNIGRRTGREVVQIYVARPDSAVDRPARWLAGYAEVTAGPGEAVTAVVRLAPRTWQHWSPAERSRRTEPGTFEVRAGRSAGDLPLVRRVTLVGHPFLPESATGSGEVPGAGGSDRVGR